MNQQNKTKLEKSKAKSVQNWSLFAHQCNAWNLDLMVFNAGRHLRAIGTGFVDYWPSTGRFWTGRGKASKDVRLLANALEGIARKPHEDLDLQHIREIAQNDDQ